MLRTLTLLLALSVNLGAQSTDDTWSVLGQVCSGAQILQRNAGNTAWECVPGLAAGTVDTAKIATDAITNAAIITGAVNGRTISICAANEVYQMNAGGTAWACSAVAGGSGISQLTGNVTAGPGSGSQVATIAAGVIDTAKMATDSIVNASIITGAIDTRALAVDAVAAIKILGGAVDTSKIATDAIITGKIITSAVETSKLATDAVTTAKIITGAVQTAKIASDAVTDNAILNGTITFPKVGANSCTANQVMKRNAGNTAWVCSDDNSGGAGSEGNTFTSTKTFTTTVALAADGGSVAIGTRAAVVGSVFTSSGSAVIQSTSSFINHPIFSVKSDSGTTSIAINRSGDIWLGTGRTRENPAITIWLNNASSVTLNAGEIVIMSTTSAFSVNRTVTASTTSVVGVVYDLTIAANTVGRIAIGGVVSVRNSAAVAVAGRHCVTSTTAGRAQSTAAPTSGSSIGIWLQTAAASTSGLVLLK